MESEIDELLAKVDSAHGWVTKELAIAKGLFDRLDAAIGATQESSSGSWAGYQASLYFRDFERPPLESRFSVEWGAIHGIPLGWDQRTKREVTEHVESASGVSISELEKISERVYYDVRPLYQDVQALVTAILESSGESSKQLLEDLRGETWGYAQATYINKVQPSTFMSRDSEALSEGLKTPPHVAVRARVVFASSRITAAQAALERAKLALQQSRAALRVCARQASTQATGASAVAPRSRRFTKWIVLGLIVIVAVESFILVRPFVLAWFDSTFTQEFLKRPTRLGFSLSDILANLLAALIFAPFAALFALAVRKRRIFALFN